VDDVVGREHRNDHQEDGADALEPRRPAEEQPPQQDQRAAGHGSEQADHGAVREQWCAEADEHQQHRESDAGPQPQRFSDSRFVCSHIQIASGVR
jgi:hypothetical protein